MPAVQYIQINIFAIILLFILWLHFRRNSADKFLSDQRIFEWMLLNNIVILIVDVGTGVLDGRGFAGAYTANMIVSVMYYALNPVMGFLYCMFCEVKLGTSSKKLRKWAVLYISPVIINLICCIVNIFTPVFFEIDDSNTYNRGPLFLFSFVLAYILVLYVFFKVFYRIETEDRHTELAKAHWSLMAFPLPPLIGGIAQIYMEGVSVIWISTVISLFIIYVNIQNTQMSADALTGLFNRGQMMPYLRWKMADKKRKNNLYFIIMDLDHLKFINDNYGHVAGDKSLVGIADAIKASIGKKDFAARYGGDEFIVIAERSCEDEIKAIISDIDSNLIEWNRKAQDDYYVSVSVGYTRLDGSFENIKDMIATADEMMYVNKKK